MTQPDVARIFPDVQRVLVDALTVWVGEVHTDIETPDNLQEELPFVRVLRTGGGRTRLADVASVDLDVFHATYADGWALAERITQWLCGPPPPISVFDRVECTISPRELPWGVGNVRRFNASFTVVSRRVRAA